MSYHNELMRAQKRIIIMRVENGWVVCNQDEGLGIPTPLQVAETASKLVTIVDAWAAGSLDRVVP